MAHDDPLRAAVRELLDYLRAPGGTSRLSLEAWDYVVAAEAALDAPAPDPVAAAANRRTPCPILRHDEAVAALQDYRAVVDAFRAVCTPSQVCRVLHVQDCWRCEDLGCQDNTNEAAIRALPTVEAPRTAPEKVKRAPGCQCHQEEGDSPCPVHDGTRWTLLEKTSPSGKRLFLCESCGRESYFPDKTCAAGCKDPSRAELRQEFERIVESAGEVPAGMLAQAAPEAPRVGRWGAWYCYCDGDDHKNDVDTPRCSGCNTVRPPRVP